MKKFLLAGLACLALSEGAQAATITIAVTSPSVTFTKTLTVANADVARLVAPYIAAYTTVDAMGNPVVPTPAQAFTQFLQGVFQGMLNNATQFAQQQAAQTAVTATPGVTGTVN